MSAPDGVTGVTIQQLDDHSIKVLEQRQDETGEGIEDILREAGLVDPENIQSEVVENRPTVPKGSEWFYIAGGIYLGLLLAKGDVGIEEVSS